MHKTWSLILHHATPDVFGGEGCQSICCDKLPNRGGDTPKPLSFLYFLYTLSSCKFSSILLPHLFLLLLHLHLFLLLGVGERGGVGKGGGVEVHREGLDSYAAHEQAGQLRL